MRLSTKGRYAVMAMVDLAKHSAGNPISLADPSFCHFAPRPSRTILTVWKTIQKSNPTEAFLM